MMIVPIYTLFRFQASRFLSGAKPTKPSLHPNFAKEPFRPSRSKTGFRGSTNMINIQIENKNRQCLTRGHKTCRFQWVFDGFVPPQAFATVDNDTTPQSDTFHTPNRKA